MVDFGLLSEEWADVPDGPVSFDEPVTDPCFEGAAVDGSSSDVMDWHNQVQLYTRPPHS